MSQSLWSIYETLLSGAIYTDLTHAFFPEQPRSGSFPSEERKALMDYSQGDDYQVHHYAHVGQWGTHVDPPIHFIKGARTLDQIPVREMLLPLVVLDIAARVAVDSDTVASLDDITSFEKQHGRIPAGSFVALRTDWSKRWPDATRMHNRDAAGMAHYPGWSQEVLSCLIEERQVTAIGHETIDTDPGLAVTRHDYGLERYVLAQDRWQIELLTNLDRVPVAGALIMATWPKPLAGSGFPARVVAIHR